LNVAQQAPEGGCGRQKERQEKAAEKQKLQTVDQFFLFGRRFDFSLLGGAHLQDSKFLKLLYGGVVDV
jgi:hypothetical protein